MPPGATLDGVSKSNKVLTILPYQTRKSNTPFIKRYLMWSSHLIFLRDDSRKRVAHNNFPPQSRRFLYDLTQEEIASVYFDNANRTIIARSKTDAHKFANPDWSLMEAYLLPWIHFNSLRTHVFPTRMQIKHMAFRIWEFLATQGRVALKHKEREGLPKLNVAFGDLRGWWLETDGQLPCNYGHWIAKRSSPHQIPGDYKNVVVEVMAKPWPAKIWSPIFLVVDLETPTSQDMLRIPVPAAPGSRGAPGVFPIYSQENNPSFAQTVRPTIVSGGALEVPGIQPVAKSQYRQVQIYPNTNFELGHLDVYRELDLGSMPVAEGIPFNFTIRNETGLVSPHSGLNEETTSWNIRSDYTT